MISKRTSLLPGLVLLCLVCLLSSCQEKEEEGEYDNWQTRNEAYVDSIARVARANADGRWTVLKVFTRGDSLDDSGENRYYVYVHKLADGTGTQSPLYNDSVRVHYSGRLVPSTSYPQGYNFGKSYNGLELNEATDVPTLLAVNQNVTGFATALMNMVVGDDWLVVVPWQLGYGSSANTTGSIPAYSTLIFEMRLARIYRYGIDTDTSWW